MSTIFLFDHLVDVCLRRMTIKQHRNDTMSIKIGDHVHAGFREKGGSGFYGMVRKIKGSVVYIFTGTSTFGDLLVQASIDLVTLQTEMIEKEKEKG